MEMSNDELVSNINLQMERMATTLGMIEDAVARQARDAHALSQQTRSDRAYLQAWATLLATTQGPAKEK